MNDDDRLLDELGRALTPTPPPPGPPAERVAALRAAAEARGGAAPAAGGTPVTPLAAPPGRTRRGVLGLGVAAAAGAVAGIGVREAVVDDPDRPPEPPYQDVAFAAPPAGITITSSRLIDHTWGVELVLDVTGLAAGAAHTVRFVGLDGVVTDAGGFLGVDGPLVCRCNGPRRKAELASIEVLDDADDVVLRASVL